MEPRWGRRVAVDIPIRMGTPGPPKRLSLTTTPRGSASRGKSSTSPGIR